LAELDACFSVAFFLAAAQNQAYAESMHPAAASQLRSYQFSMLDVVSEHDLCQ
jgi:hypothetical protein